MEASRLVGQGRGSLNYELILFVPQEIRIQLELPDPSSILYRVDGKRAPLNPYRMNIICPRSPLDRVPPEEQLDDLLLIAGILGIDAALVESVVDEIHGFQHANARNIRFEQEDDRRTMFLDLDGTVPGLPFRGLSGRERETVLLEFATALARFCGRYAPTLLILDSFVSIFFESWFCFHIHRLLDPENQFQTVLTVPARQLDLVKIRWNVGRSSELMASRHIAKLSKTSSCGRSTTFAKQFSPRLQRGQQVGAQAQLNDA